MEDIHAAYLRYATLSGWLLVIQSKPEAISVLPRYLGRAVGGFFISITNSLDIPQRPKKQVFVFC